MKRIAVLLASLVTAALVIGVAPAAQADVPPAKLPNASICLVPDFPLVGSHWPVGKAVKMWSDAQDTVQLSVGNNIPGCLVVPVHRYHQGDGYACGATRVQGIILETGAHVSTGADIWLNDDCLDIAGRGYMRTIIAHEIGHAMGLDHMKSTRSVMYEYHGTRKFIALVDVRALAARYASV